MFNDTLLFPVFIEFEMYVPSLALKLKAWVYKYFEGTIYYSDEFCQL